MSKLKRKLADAACMTAWGWQPGEGERLIVQFGLGRMEWALNEAGLVWSADAKEWTDTRAETRGKAA